MIYTYDDLSISTNDLVGNISNFPIEVVHRMITESILQGSSKKKALRALAISSYSTRSNNGFDWQISEEGLCFWNDVAIKNFSKFCDSYPIIGEYKIESTDHFPWITENMSTDIISRIITNHRIQNFDSMDKSMSKLKTSKDFLELFNPKESFEGFTFWEKLSNKCHEPQLVFPSTWEECAKVYREKGHKLEKINAFGTTLKVGVNYGAETKNCLPVGYGDAIIALSQLLVCRETYLYLYEKYKDNSLEDRDGSYYKISILNGDILKTDSPSPCGMFSFVTKDVRDKFFENFKELLEKITILFY